MDSSLIRVRAARRALPIKPLLLKDHLLLDDDIMIMSSSSNGFKSFPRTSHCCTTLPFRQHNKTPSKSALSASFRSVITAVKCLPFAAAKPPEKIRLNCSSSLGQSFFWKSGFWKKKAIGRWRLFDQLSVSDHGKYSSADVNFLKLPDVVKDGAENGAVSTDDNSKQWRQSDQEKEHLSLMSVLGCPFDDECCTGTKTKLMTKIQRFEFLEQGVSLATQFALQSDNPDHEYFSSPLPHCSNAFDELVDHKTKANFYSPSHHDDLKVIEDKLLRDMSVFDEEMENWEKTLGHSIKWEVQKNMQVYVDGKEKQGGWRTLDRERKEVSLDLENEVFVDLMNESLIDID